MNVFEEADKEWGLLLIVGLFNSPIFF